MNGFERAASDLKRGLGIRQDADLSRIDSIITQSGATYVFDRSGLLRRVAYGGRFMEGED